MSHEAGPRAPVSWLLTRIMRVRADPCELETVSARTTLQVFVLCSLIRAIWRFCMQQAAPSGSKRPTGAIRLQFLREPPFTFLKRERGKGLLLLF